MRSTTARAFLWRARIADWWAGVWRWVLLALGAGAAVYLVLDNAGSHGLFTAIALVVLVIGAIATYSEPMAMALAAMPLLFVMQRVGFGGTDLSVSDAALAAAFGTALLLGQRPYSRPMRQMLWLNGAYQFATFFTVIVNPQIQNTVEWFHAWMLISGALIVGWSLGRAGLARTALILLVSAACVIAVGTLITAVFEYASGNFGPIYPRWPWSMHKNFAGTSLAFAALILYANPEWARLSGRWAGIAFWTLLLAIVVTQSRQALVSLLVGIVVVVFRRSVTRRSRAALLLIIPIVWLVVSMVIEQIESQNQHNSLFQRIDWMREVYAFWKHAPVFGHGLRFWYYNPTVPYQPPQAELEVATSAGIVGLIGFVAMWVGILIVLWRIDPAYGTLAFAITLSRIIQAQFDLFWVAVQVSIPFVVAGLCVGALAHRDAERRSSGMLGEQPGLASPRTAARVGSTVPRPERASGRTS